MEVVAEQAPQRARLLDAMIDVVADKGYAAATVADAVRAARVSRGTFYALFASKEACFIEAYRRGVDNLDAHIERAVHDEAGDWRARLRAGLRCYLERMAAEPRLARTWLLELHVAGPVAQAERDATLRRFADRYRRSFEAALGERDDLAMPSDDALFMLAAGVDQLVCARVRAGELERLPDLTESLLTCAVAQLEGTASTRRGDR
jgi:AcrR family transcriptional regulator